jgi:uncharacterized protein (UPF0333 family)
MKKAQFSLEFLLLLAVMFIIFTGFLAVTTTKILNAKDRERQQIAEDIAVTVRDEIEFANSLQDGYERTFTLPPKINGNTYTVTVLDNREIVVTYLDKEHVEFLPGGISGTVDVGLNTVRKENGIVYLSNSKDISFFVLKDVASALTFKENGNAVLQGTLQQNTAPVATADDEFIVKNSLGEDVLILNLATGNMVIKGTLFENQGLISNPLSDDFVVKSSNGEIVSYVNGNGDFYLKGVLTQGP